MQIFFTVPFFFFLKAVIPGHMEPIPLSSVVLSLRRASGRGWVSVRSCLVTVSPGSLLFVDMWSRAAYCRPDVGTHLQLTREDADTGPSVSTSIGRRQLCVIPWSINQLLLCLFKTTLYGCWPNFTRMHEVKKCFFFFVCVSRIQMSNRKWRTEAMYEQCGEWLYLSQLHTVSLGMYQHFPPLGSPSPRCPCFPTLCSNFSTTTAPKPPCLHNEFSQSDYSCTILLSLIIRQELKLKTFVSYYFNSAISMSPWWPSHPSVIINLIVLCT